jgi:hypothetical protein
MNAIPPRQKPAGVLGKTLGTVFSVGIYFSIGYARKAAIYFARMNHPASFGQFSDPEKSPRREMYSVLVQKRAAAEFWTPA